MLAVVFTLTFEWAILVMNCTCLNMYNDRTCLNDIFHA